MFLVNIIFTHLRSLLNRIRSAIVNLNIFDDAAPRTAATTFREMLLTRLFFVLLTISTIASGFYTLLVRQSELITIENPSLSTYQQLYSDHADTLQCSCARQSISYGSFLNVTFDLHQVCFSDLVSTPWLNYLESFDPVALPSWIDSFSTQDFRTMGNSYFQLLAAFCSLTKGNIADAQSSFSSIQLVNARMLPSLLFIQQTDAIMASYVDSTRNDFQRTVAWIRFVFTGSYLVTGVNTNSAIDVGQNNTVVIGERTFAVPKYINHTSFILTDLCSCPVEFDNCFIPNLLYANETDTLAYKRYFFEIPIGCIPLLGFLRSTFTWWYDQNHLEDIQDTYSRVILSKSSPIINALDASLPSKYQYQSLEYLLNQMFIEPPTHQKALFDLYYDQCAPSSCSYTVVKRRDLLVALLLLISICGGWNRILRILVKAFGKLFYFLIDWWKNREGHNRK